MAAKKKKKHALPQGLVYEDDGKLYYVVTPDGRRVYSGDPIVKGHAQALADGLLYGGMIEVAR